jgi:hypothetical protein
MSRASRVDSMMARATEVASTMDEMQVLETLLLQLATDPELHQQIAYRWMTTLFRSRDVSVQRMLTQRINTLLTARALVELSYATVLGRDHGALYLFGRELAIFAIPLDVLRTNFVALACVLRLVAQGHATTGTRLFGVYRRSIGNTESTWSSFRHNSIVQQRLERAPLMTAIVAYTSAMSFRSDASSSFVKKHAQTTRLLMLAVLTDSLSQIFASGSTLDRYPWLDAGCFGELHALRALCTGDATFNALEFDRLLLSQYARICKNQIVDPAREPTLET